MTDLLADLDAHHIEGYARAAIDRGQDGRFHVPLISHIEGNLYVGGCRDGVRLPDDDAADLPDEKHLLTIAGIAAKCIGRGKTLIHCQAGLNRSNLVAALALRYLTPGRTSAEIIAQLRAKRSPVVLCNETFERYLLTLDGL